jgi:hypothetical protein
MRVQQEFGEFFNRIGHKLPLGRSLKAIEELAKPVWTGPLSVRVKRL